MTSVVSKSVVLLVLGHALFACKKSEPASQLKYGHIQEVGWTDNTVFSLEPKEETIDGEKAWGVRYYVCDNTTSKSFGGMATSAIDRWFGILSSFVLIEKSCSNYPMVRLTDTTKCSTPNAIAETIPILPLSKKPEELIWEVRLCKPEKVKYAVMLHELGHIFGQCDRYKSKAEDGIYHPMMGANCDGSEIATNGNFTAPSAMQVPGKDHPCEITDDDREGVYALVKRGDIRVHPRWAEFLNELQKEPVGPVLDFEPFARKPDGGDRKYPCL